MKLASAVSLATVGWLALISTLHVWLNFDHRSAAEEGPSFRVGFLPVT
ncbi:MAG: hypothetical protein JNL08_20815 [Planctomycetes bacterium]|nr:hypothetical protein [Planctomycetota bacterium]